MTTTSVTAVLAALRQELSCAAPGAWAVASTAVHPGISLRVLDESPDGDVRWAWTTGLPEPARAPSNGSKDELRRILGWDCAKIFQVKGEERLTNLKNQLEKFSNNNRDLFNYSPFIRFFGGSSFSEEHRAGELWSSWGEAVFFLPRLLCVDEPSQARLFVVVPPGELELSLRQAEHFLKRAWDLVPSSSASSPPVASELPSTSPGHWSHLVQTARERILQGDFSKVVLARSRSFRFETIPRPSLLLAGLEEQAPHCTRFLLQRGRQTFLGATPERLVKCEGRIVQTEALAGSSPSDPENAEALLLGRAKDRAEHAFVVSALREALELLSSSLEIPERPEIRHLRNIIHLHTPIRAELREATHVLDLVARLHPTPAVGGLPRPAALDFIAEHEPTERGWYASPLGWIDGEGNGEFVVALRSALLDGSVAHVFAGAGIVQDSDPSEEFAETELKMRGMLRALGLVN